MGSLVAAKRPTPQPQANAAPLRFLLSRLLSLQTSHYLSVFLTFIDSFLTVLIPVRLALLLHLSALQEFGVSEQGVQPP